MKPQIVLVLAVVLMMIDVFARPLGISDTWQNIATICTFICFAAYFILLRKAKSELARNASDVRPPRSGLRLLLIVLVIGASLSSVWWSPYTIGVVLPLSERCGIAIVGSVLCVIILLIAWRRPPQDLTKR